MDTMQLIVTAAGALTLARWIVAAFELLDDPRKVKAWRRAPSSSRRSGKEATA